MPSRNFIAQSGQVALMVLLIMVVLLTAGLALASRTAQNLILSENQAETTRVFNAAEQSIDQALSGEMVATQGEVTVAGLDEDLEARYTVAESSVLETLVFEGATVEFDLTGVAAGSSLSLNWSRISDCAQEPASLIVAIYYNDAGETWVRYYPVGACAAERADGFSAPAGGSDGYSYSSTLALTDQDLFARIKPVYNDTYLKVEGAGWTVGPQHYKVRAEAESTNGDEARTVEVWQTLPSAPSVFDYALYSGTTIVK